MVLVGPSGAGKSSWAASRFAPGQVVASDDLRALVGEGPADQRAGSDAFAVLDLVLERRLRRGLTTVVDTLGLDGERRRGYVALARRHGRPVHAVVFDTPAKECRARNARRERPVPAPALRAQLAALPRERKAVEAEGFDGVHAPDEEVAVVPPAMLDAPAAAARQATDPLPLEFGLHLPRFTWDGGPAGLGERLAQIARCAEEVGITSLWVMDHLVQIPQVGREWDEMLEAYTTLGYLAGITRTVRLGALVTGITYRNVAQLAKIVATLDVLSGGRAACGLGAAWFEREHRLYGYDFPPLAQRYELLEDALRLLPLMWGPGAPAFSGHRIEVPEAVCYPRPLQARIPILVGGGGERRTLRLVAEHADACNVFGQADEVRHKVAVLRRHCADLGRDPAEVAVTHLSTVLCAPDRAALAERVERLRPAGQGAEPVAAAVNAGTVTDHVGRFRALAESGVATAIVSLADLDGTAAVEDFAPVIAAFRG